MAAPKLGVAGQFIGVVTDGQVISGAVISLTTIVLLHVDLSKERQAAKTYH